MLSDLRTVTVQMTLLFQIFALRNHIPGEEQPEARRHFFSKGQACMRASPLTKWYCRGVHNDETGKIALFGRETDRYQLRLKYAAVNSGCSCDAFLPEEIMRCDFRANRFFSSFVGTTTKILG